MIKSKDLWYIRDAGWDRHVVLRCFDVDLDAGPSRSGSDRSFPLCKVCGEKLLEAMRKLLILNKKEAVK